MNGVGLWGAWRRGTDSQPEKVRQTKEYLDFLRTADYPWSLMSSPPAKATQPQSEWRGRGRRGGLSRGPASATYKHKSGTSVLVQWLRLYAGGPAWIPGQGTRFHMQQARPDTVKWINKLNTYLKKHTHKDKMKGGSKRVKDLKPSLWVSEAFL